MTVFAPLLGHLWRTLASYGVEPGEVVNERLYRPGDKTLTGRRVSFREYDKLLDRVMARVDDPALGLRTAQFLHPSHLGALGHAWLASSTLRSALRRFARLARMYNEQVGYTFEESLGMVSMSCRPVVESSHPDVVADAQLANLLQLCRINFGPDLMPVEVTLIRPEPSDPAPWIETFGQAVSFGQARNTLSLNLEDATTPLTGSNPELVAIHEEVIERYLLKLDRDNIVNRLRLALIEEMPSGGVSEEEMARRLSLSKRTMNRKLRENGTSYRKILTSVRKDLARRYVHDRDFSVTEMAFLLGYNNPSAFSRAFSSWFGHSPIAARKKSD